MSHNNLLTRDSAKTLALDCVYFRFQGLQVPGNQPDAPAVLTLYDPDLDHQFEAAVAAPHLAHLTPYLTLVSLSECDPSIEPPVIPVRQIADGQWQFAHLSAEEDYPELSQSPPPPFQPKLVDGHPFSD